MVFGAGGFLGARICALLADRGVEYRGLSRSRGEPYRLCDLAAMHSYALDTQIGMYKPTVIVNAWTYVPAGRDHYVDTLPAVPTNPAGFYDWILRYYERNTR